MSQMENRVKNIANLLSTANKSLRKAQSLLESLEKDMESSYEDIPGVLGVFDGEAMVTPEGKSYDVNPNYAAKSMLVVGDNLKMIEEEGKQLFKQVTKVPRLELNGVLNKKEGSWYVLTDAGTYKLLDVAVDFRRGEVNDEVVVQVPEENKKSAFAALVKLAKEDERPVIDEEKAAKSSEEKIETEKKEKKEKEPAKKSSTAKKTTKAKAKAKPAEKVDEKEKAKKESKKAENEVASILEEDDLV